ncbi:hypothetical protein GCM10023096_04470 [Nonomuraea ferruginea]
MYNWVGLVMVMVQLRAEALAAFAAWAGDTPSARAAAAPSARARLAW